MKAYIKATELPNNVLLRRTEAALARLECESGLGLLLDGVMPRAPVYQGLPGRLGGEVTLLLAQVNPDNSNLSPGELSQFGLVVLTLARDAHQKGSHPTQLTLHGAGHCSTMRFSHTPKVSMLAAMPARRCFLDQQVHTWFFIFI